MNKIGYSFYQHDCPQLVINSNGIQIIDLHGLPVGTYFYRRYDLLGEQWWKKTSEDTYPPVKESDVPEHMRMMALLL